MRVDVGVMPATRPEAISNRIRLAYEFAAEVSAFIAEHCTVDALLATVVFESSPYEHGVSFGGTEDDLFPWPGEQDPASSVFVLISRVVSFIEFKAIKVTILRKPPDTRRHT